MKSSSGGQAMAIPNISNVGPIGSLLGKISRVKLRQRLTQRGSLLFVTRLIIDRNI